MVETNGNLESQFQLPKIKFTKLFINGQFVDSVSGNTFETIDPRNGEVIARIAEGDKEDIDLAVKAAREAFDNGPWPRLSPSERRNIMLKFADLMVENAEEIAALDAMDAGKLFAPVKNIDIPAAAEVIRYYAGAADKIHGTTLKMSREFQGYTLLEPIGVVGHIIPWNFPTQMFVMKVGPALAAGCTMIVKPAEQTPLSALYYAQLAKQAGVPDGVINVVTGFGSTAGAALCSHMDVDKISFTGSTEVGRLVMQAAALSNLKPVSLELGGKSPFIVFDDVDVDKVAPLALIGILYNKGEICVAGSRLFIQEGIYDKFVKKLEEMAKTWVVGDPFDPNSHQGPQVDKKQFERVLSYIEHGKREGATLLTGGKALDRKGYFIEPTIFIDVEAKLSGLFTFDAAPVSDSSKIHWFWQIRDAPADIFEESEQHRLKDDMTIAKEEIFGPVLSVMKFKTVEEVIKRANCTSYGLAAGVMTNDLNIANTVSRSIRAGVIWINCYFAFDPDCPYGGYKCSGFERDLGMEGLHKYLQVKSVATPIYNSPWL